MGEYKIPIAKFKSVLLTKYVNKLNLMNSLKCYAEKFLAQPGNRFICMHIFQMNKHHYVYNLFGELNKFIKYIS